MREYEKQIPVQVSYIGLLESASGAMVTYVDFRCLATEVVVTMCSFRLSASCDFEGDIDDVASEKNVKSEPKSRNKYK